MYFANKTILVIGGTGTIGKKIVEILLGLAPKAIRIYSRDEYKQFVMENELFDKREKLRFLIGDVRDAERLDRATKDVDIIFHLAAMKHVPACEYNPFEAVKTNVIGTQNVIGAAFANNVEHVVLTSSDKAISPTNAMGATKLLAERLIAAADGMKGSARTILAAVRFGNVMGSRGSVIPLFKKQMLDQGRITVTSGAMSRFMMTITQAAALTVKALTLAVGGEVFVLKMPVVRLDDLVAAVLEETCRKHNINYGDIEIQHIGLRPGEKPCEELLTKEEAKNTYELDDMFAILPTLSGKDYSAAYTAFPKAANKSYSSEDQKPISRAEIIKILRDEKLI